MVFELALLLLIVFAPVVAGMATLLLPRRLVERVRGAPVVIGLLGPIASLTGLWLFIDRFGLERGRVSAPWMPQLNLNWAFAPDRLGLFFACLIAGIGLLILVYGRAYLGPDAKALRKFYPLITLFMTAMLGLVLADDFLLMLVFWELTSVSSFLLIGWDHDDNRAVRNALQALITTGVGGLAMFGGLVWLGVLTGDWSFTSLEPVAGGGTMLAAFCLIYLGVATKSAQWPLHSWLPGAMLAPTPISAYLHSAAMVKAGIYLLARLWPTMSELSLWPPLVIGIGGLTMVLGAFIALQQDVLKQILAYTTVSQLGLLAVAFGLASYYYGGEPSIVWGNGQVLNHACYKAALFMLAGGVAHLYGKARLGELHGIWYLPDGRIYAILFVLGLLALAAMPGTYSFFAKEAFLYGVWHAAQESGSGLLYLLLLAAILTSAFNVAIFLRFTIVLLQRPISRTVETSPELAFHGEAAAHHYDEAAHRDSRFWIAMLWIPAALLIGAQFFGGIAGPIAARWLAPLEATPFYWHPENFSLLHAFAHPGAALVFSLTGTALGVLLGLSRFLRRIHRDWHDKLFPAAYQFTLRSGEVLFGLVQNGRLRWYLVGTSLGLVGIVGWIGYIGWRNGELVWSKGFPSLLDAPAPWMLCGLVCAAALAMVLVRDRVTRVLVLGTVGFSVTGVFYVYMAPDLALTQLSIEIVSLILFLLVLDLLPSAREGRRTLVPLRLTIALLVGVTIFTVTLCASTGPRPQRPPLLVDGSSPQTLGDFFLRNSYYGLDTALVDPSLLGRGVVTRGSEHLRSFGSEADKPARQALSIRAAKPAGGDNVAGLASPAVLGDASVDRRVTLHKGGGGSNVVNVILVDFRGFDTLGEIVVLALAAMGVWTLLRKPPSPHDRLPTDNRSLPFDDTFIDPYALPGAVPAPLPRGRTKVHSEQIASVILRSAVRVLIPLALVFGVYLFLKGHQSPGGGFVAGLATAVALVVYRMCFGAEALYNLLPVRERTLIALGLLLAIGTATVPLLFGLPLLTSNNGYFSLPGGVQIHWATVLVFDLGVFLVVVGSVVGMIDAIARELE